MKTRSWMLTGLAAFAVVFALDLLIHTRVLVGLYQTTAAVWRPHSEAGARMALMTLTQVAFGLAFAWVYTKGYEPATAGVTQGLWYGLYAGALLVAYEGLTWYVVLPIPLVLPVAWLVSTFVKALAAGAVVGWLYRE